MDYKGKIPIDYRDHFKRMPIDFMARVIKEAGLPWYRFKCPRCNFRGITIGALDIHIELIHIRSGLSIIHLLPLYRMV